MAKIKTAASKGKRTSKVSGGRAAGKGGAVSRKIRNGAVDHADAHERKTAETVMATVLKENNIELTTERLDQWVTIECPHCGEGSELHVIADMDGQSIDQDCAVCCRAFVAHVEIDEGEAHVGVETA